MKLRHLQGPNLSNLERELEILGSQVPLQIVGINFMGSTWFIHYCVVLNHKNRKIKVEVANPTQTINPKAG